MMMMDVSIPETLIGTNTTNNTVRHENNTTNNTNNNNNNSNHHRRITNNLSPIRNHDDVLVLDASSAHQKIIRSPTRFFPVVFSSKHRRNQNTNQTSISTTITAKLSSSSTSCSVSSTSAHNHNNSHNSMNEDLTESSVSSCNGYMISPIPKKRSCFKGSRAAAMASSQNQNNASSSSLSSITRHNHKKQLSHPRMAVRFGNGKFSKFTEFYIVPASFAEVEDGDITTLWWTRTELDECRRNQLHFVDAPEEARRAVKLFLDSYEIMRKELYRDDHNNSNNNNNEATNTTNKNQDNFNDSMSTIGTSTSRRTGNGGLNLSSENYYHLTKGYAYGFNGLEKIVGYDKEIRWKRYREIVQKIIECSRRTNHDQQIVASLAQSCTSRDRKWARAAGNAASVAARH